MLNDPNSLKFKFRNIRQCQAEYQSYQISKLQTNTATINQIHFRNIKVSHCVAKNAIFLNVI